MGSEQEAKSIFENYIRQVIGMEKALEPAFAFITTLTPEQAAIYKAFVAAISSSCDKAGVRASALPMLLLLRFLKAARFVVESAVKSFEKSLQWRINNDIAHIGLFKYPEWREVRKVYPFTYHKVDKRGRPIYESSG